MSRIKVDPVFTTRSIFDRRARKIAAGVAGLLAAGGAVAMAAYLWSQPIARSTAPREAVSASLSAEPTGPAYAAAQLDPSASGARPTEDPSVIEGASVLEHDEDGPDADVQGERPVVALEHDDLDTDYQKLAREQIELGDVNAALGSLRKHIYRNEPTADVLLNIGRLGRQAGEHAIAEQALLDAAALDPKNVETQVELSRILLEVGELEDARIHARQAIRLDPEHAIAWNVAGRIAMQQSNWARAETALKRAAELDPTNAMIHNNLGLLYIYTHRGKDAIDSLETAVELFNDESPYFVYNNLGLAHELAGNLAEARTAFEEALALNPTYSRAKVNLDRIESTIASREEKTTFETAKGVAPPLAGVEESPALRP